MTSCDSRWVMSSESLLLRVLLASCVVCSVVGCADFRRGAYWDDVEADEDAADETEGVDGELRFGADVYPLLVDGCASCHEPGALDYVVSGDIDETYDATVRIVDIVDPTSSRLLHKTRGDGHGGGAVYDRMSEEYAVILSWIEQGAVP
jgi:hypothetical protein